MSQRKWALTLPFKLFVYDLKQTFRKRSLKFHETMIPVDFEMMGEEPYVYVKMLTQNNLEMS